MGYCTPLSFFDYAIAFCVIIFVLLSNIRANYKSLKRKYDFHTILQSYIDVMDVKPGH